MTKNYLGQEIGNKPYRLRKDSYSKGISILTGCPIVNWDIVQIKNPNADEDGFDTRYPRECVVLPVGTKIIRYGKPIGNYTAPYGTEYEELSLPYVKETIEYHEYVVIKPIDVEKNVCVVKGLVAEGFDQRGGGIQYHHSNTIQELINEKCLMEDESWIEKL